MKFRLLAVVGVLCVSNAFAAGRAEKGSEKFVERSEQPAQECICDIACNNGQRETKVRFKAANSDWWKDLNNDGDISPEEKCESLEGSLTSCSIGPTGNSGQIINCRIR